MTQIQPLKENDNHKTLEHDRFNLYLNRSTRNIACQKMSSDNSQETGQNSQNSASDEPSDHKLKLHSRRHNHPKEFDADKLRKPHTVVHGLGRPGLGEILGGNAGGLLRNDRRPEAPSEKKSSAGE